MFALDQMILVTPDGNHLRTVDRTGAPAWWLATTGTTAPVDPDPWFTVPFVASLPSAVTALACVVSGFGQLNLVVLTAAQALVFDRALALVRTVDLAPLWPEATAFSARGIKLLPGGDVAVLVSGTVGVMNQYALYQFSPNLVGLIAVQQGLPGVPTTRQQLVPFDIDGFRVVYFGENEAGDPTLFTWIRVNTTAAMSRIDEPPAPVVQQVPANALTDAVVATPSARTFAIEEQVVINPQAGEPVPDAHLIQERDPTGTEQRTFPTQSPREVVLGKSPFGYWVVSDDLTADTLLLTEYDQDGAIRQRVTTPDFTT